jgi:hypothetical protein
MAVVAAPAFADEAAVTTDTTDTGDDDGKFDTDGGKVDVNGAHTHGDAADTAFVAAALGALIGADAVTTAASAVLPFVTTWRGGFNDDAAAVVATPATATELMAVMQWCKANNRHMVVVGANLSLKDQTLSRRGDIIVSTRRLDFAYVVDNDADNNINSGGGNGGGDGGVIVEHQRVLIVGAGTTMSTVRGVCCECSCDDRLSSLLSANATLTIVLLTKTISLCVYVSTGVCADASVEVPFSLGSDGVPGETTAVFL